MYLEVIKKVNLLILACLTVCSLQAKANPYDYDMFSNIGRGHFNARSLSPGHILRPNIPTSPMAELEPGAGRVTTGISWGNVWSFNPVEAFLIDAEWITFNTTMGYTPCENIEIGFTLPFSYRFGGVLDGMVENFHDLVGLDNENRDTRPQNEALIYLENNNGDLYLDEDSSGINDIPIFISWIITKGDLSIPAIAFQIGMTIPVGDETSAEGLGKPLFGLSILTSKRIGITRHLVMLGASISHTSQDETLFIEIEQTEFSGMAAWEYNWGSNKSIIAQYIASSPSTKNAYRLSESTHEMNIGYKHEINDTSIFEINIMENLFAFDNSTDIGFNIGVTKIF